MLGNQGNVSEFWFRGIKDDDRGLLAYLAAASGVKTVVGSSAVQASDTSPQAPRPPEVVARERPPSGRAEALQRWQKAREAFRASINAAHAGEQALEQLRQKSVELDELEAELNARVAERDGCQTCLGQTIAVVESARNEAALKDRELSEAAEQLIGHDATKPAWWRRLLWLADARAWSAQRREKRARVAVCRRATKTAAVKLVQLENDLRRTTLQLEAAAAKVAQCTRKYEELRTSLEVAAKKLDATPISVGAISRATTEQARAAIHTTAPGSGRERAACERLCFHRCDESASSLRRRRRRTDTQQHIDDFRFDQTGHAGSAASCSASVVNAVPRTYREVVADALATRRDYATREGRSSHACSLPNGLPNESATLDE